MLDWAISGPASATFEAPLASATFVAPFDICWDWWGMDVKDQKKRQGEEWERGTEFVRGKIVGVYYRCKGRPGSVKDGEWVADIE